MAEELNENEISAMIDEMKDIFEKHVTEDPDVAAPFMNRAGAIRDKLSHLGFAVTLKVVLSLKTLKVRAEIELRPLKASPEMTRILDKVFLLQSNIKPESSE